LPEHFVDDLGHAERTLNKGYTGLQNDNDLSHLGNTSSRFLPKLNNTKSLRLLKAGVLASEREANFLRTEREVKPKRRRVYETGRRVISTGRVVGKRLSCDDRRTSLEKPVQDSQLT